jgi:hypothetical protein
MQYLIVHLPAIILMVLLLTRSSAIGIAITLTPVKHA